MAMETELVPAGGSTDSGLMQHGAGVPGTPMQQVRGSYTTAIAVQQPRSLPLIEKKLLEECDQAGEDFFYGWGSGKNRVEGPSVGLANSAVRIYGNCAVEMLPIQDTRDSWIFTASFIDLETGFTLQRQFRQSKRWTVHGKFDEARKEDIRFQIGQSKAVRNVVLNALPKWLITRAVDRAKGGVRTKLEGYIAKVASDKHGGNKDEAVWAVAKQMCDKLASLGVDEASVLHKFGRGGVKSLTIEDMVLIRADIYAIENEIETKDELYPPPQAETDPGTQPSGGTATDEIARQLGVDAGGDKATDAGTESAREADTETASAATEDGAGASESGPPPEETLPPYERFAKQIADSSKKPEFDKIEKAIIADKNLSMDERTQLSDLLDEKRGKKK